VDSRLEARRRLRSKDPTPVRGRHKRYNPSCGSLEFNTMLGECDRSAGSSDLAANTKFEVELE
jgi:hypothetical protein